VRRTDDAVRRPVGREELMAFRNLRDRRVFEKSFASLDADALAAAVQHGRLGQPAERAAVAELARRVLADEVECGAGARSDRAFLDRASVLAAAVAIAVWLARLLGLLG
jgi:hypothetical protein